ncbi:hypothetical protein [Moraxella bovis]|uniref:Uncharacterized protein n=1 Tax=Moraxella bovis TaxID=476 RepID=A0A378PXE1_MORBO|nr:hypothetical protein [Moraxella bovis]STY93231.1 Uncharacterised protein [Moraxella bovis]
MNICCVLISIVVTTPSITNVKYTLRQNLKNYDLSDTGTFKTGTHKRIYFILEDLGKTNKKAYSLALKFDDFLAKRHKSDYKLNDEINYADYIQCKKYFEVIPNLLKEIS